MLMLWVFFLVLCISTTAVVKHRLFLKHLKKISDHCNCNVS